MTKRCDQCGERDAAVNLTSVTAGAVTQEHLCQPCMDGRFGPGPSAEELERKVAEIGVELESLAARLLAAGDAADRADEERFEKLFLQHVVLTRGAPPLPHTRAYRTRPAPRRHSSTRAGGRRCGADRSCSASSRSTRR